MGDDMHQGQLAEADRHIGEGVRIVAKQRDLIGRLEKSGHETRAARQLLRQLEEALRLMQDNREMLLRDARGARAK